MLYVHENNINTKIKSQYNGRSAELEAFKRDVYLPFRERIDALIFDEAHRGSFDTAAEEFNTYYEELLGFSKKYNFKSQSKFESTFLEEISAYLFKDLPEIRGGEFGVFNKGIYAGLKIDSSRHIDIIKKDVDFCIGKKSILTIDDQPQQELILPIVAVEVKTYLDATMFGEIKSSSKAIRSASPNSKAYVLMGYKDLADEHIIAARQDASLTEMFALRSGKVKDDYIPPILADVLYDYWREIKNAVASVSEEDIVPPLGRLLNT